MATRKQAATALTDLSACTDDFAAIMSMVEAKQLAERWSDARVSVGITMAFGTIGRADMVGALRSLAEGDGGEDALVDGITAVTNLIEQTKKFVELFESIQARLFIAAAEMIGSAEAEQKVAG